MTDTSQAAAWPKQTPLKRPLFPLGKVVATPGAMAMFEALEYAQAMVPVMAGTQDAKEGLAAFQQKRAPVWTGR